ncbi:MAG TPA: hypothetical protein VJP80_00370 [Candidatus Saccharimonadales bacterium]|nr:hypothetical protein [Candidatus Saccharimonadales bacterium]
MAFTEITPINMSVAAVQGLAQFFQSTAAVVAPGTTTPVNLSSWVSWQATIVPANPGPNTAPVNFGTAAGLSTGLVTLQMATTDLATVPTGTANLIISAKPTSTDSAQVVATGTLSLQAG